MAADQLALRYRKTLALRLAYFDEFPDTPAVGSSDDPDVREKLSEYEHRLLENSRWIQSDEKRLDQSLRRVAKDYKKNIEAAFSDNVLRKRVRNFVAAVESVDCASC